MHKNAVVPSTFTNASSIHYEGNNTIQADNDRLVVVEAYFTNARFYKGQPRAGQGNEPPLTRKSLSKSRLPWIITPNR